jgi:hypothetical protein
MGEENGITESWLCVDCGTNTAPGLYCFSSGEKAGSTRAELDEAFKTADSVGANHAALGADHPAT